ncbi:MAG: DUF4163 domain-containing protein [Bacteroidota bacterium]|nr:DUF4163 domain-containing protein [Bacteroidota bacterium]MDX5505156.1 DUF4163 domain-containing protein [Bacteroidota bacterium]
MIAIVGVTVLNSCEPSADPSTQEESSISDTIQYSYHETAKYVGDCESLVGACAGFSYKELHLLGGLDPMIADKMEITLDSILFGSISEGSKTKESYLDEYLSDYQYVLDEFPDYSTPWEVDLSETVNYNRSGILGVTLVSYLFTGGAHSNNTVQYVTFDLRSGNLIHTDELFQPTDRMRVADLAATILKDSVLSRDSTDWEIISSQWGNEGFSVPDDFRLNKDGIFLLFNRNEITSGAEEEYLILLPWQEINGWIAEPYKNLSL